MKSVAIIGGGITGLTAAYRLRDVGIPVKIYEASARVGGVIQTIAQDGFLAENGPNTILETSELIGSLISDLGLESDRVYSDPAAHHRYVLRDGVPTPVPDSLLGFIKSRLFSCSAKLRIPCEVLVRQAPDFPAESVASFVARRLGSEFLDYAINPMVGGIYAGDPARLSVEHAFPKLRAVEQRYGSLFLGQLLGARERRQRGEVSTQSAPKFSFKRGLQTLTEALHERLRDCVELRSVASAIRRNAQGWEVSLAAGGVARSHSAVLLCAPAHKLADIAIDRGASSASLELLRSIPYAPISSLVLGFRREDVAHPMNGFGVLIPEVERRHLLGVVFSSSLFAGRAPKGYVTLSCYLGGMRSPTLASGNTDSAVTAAMQDLPEILGVRGQPAFVHHTYIPKAIPQYELGFGRFKTFMNKVESDFPGLYFAGHFRDGISLSNSIVAGAGAALKIGRYIDNPESGGISGSPCCHSAAVHP